MDQKDLKQIEKYHKMGWHEKIVELIDSLDEMDYDAYCLRGRAWTDLYEPYKALEDLLAVEKQGKDDPLWNYRMMYVYDMLDENQKMIEHGKKVLGHFPELDEKIVLGMTFNYLEERRFDEAQELMGEYKMEQNMDWNNMMGRLHFMKGEYVEASMYLDQGIKLAVASDEPDYVQSMAIGLYRCYEKLGKTDKVKELERVFGIAPEKLEGYSHEDLMIVEDHIAQNFGNFDMAFHEIESEIIRLDIIVSPPTPEKDHYVLTTIGMGAKIMEHMPSDLIELGYGRLELMIALPPDWNIQSEEERWSWPIQWLKILGRLPFVQEAWLGKGHTIPSRGGAYAENTELECLMLIPPFEYGEDSYEVELSNGEVVHFLQVIPIYREEVDYKLAYGADALIERFGDNFSGIVDVHRKNYAPKEMNKKYFNWTNSSLKQ